MSRRLSRGTRLYQQESINEGDEDDECFDGDFDQFPRGYGAGPGPDRSLNASSGNERRFRPTGMVRYSPDEDQPGNFDGAGGYQGNYMSSPREPGTSQGERFYHENHSPGRIPPDYQHFEISPEYQPLQASPKNGRSVSPHHTSFPERNEYSPRSFRERRGEDIAECEEGPPPRAVSPQHRPPMSPQNDHFVPGRSSSPYTTRFRVPYDNGPLDTSAYTVSPYDDSTIYREIAPFSHATRDQSSPRKSHYSPNNLEPQNFSPDSLEQQQFSPECLEQQQFSPDSLEQQHISPKRLGQQRFSPNSHEQQNFSPDSLVQQHISPKRLGQQRFSPNSHEQQNFSPDSLEQQNFSPGRLEQQRFSPNSHEQQNFSPDSLEQQNFSPDSLEPRNVSPDCPESQNFSHDSLEPRNTSGSPGARISPEYLQVPPNRLHCTPHHSSFRTPRTHRTPRAPRTPQQNEEDMNQECGGTFRKPEPEYLSLNTGSSGIHVTPSSAASSAPSYGKFGLSTPSHKGWGASPPISCVGGTPKDSKREALEHLSQLTASKPNKSILGGSPKEDDHEALAHMSQLTVSKPCKPCPGVTPKEGDHEPLDECPATVTKSVSPRCRRALDFGQAVELSPCDGTAGTSSRRLPKKPDLSQDEIKELIDSEAEDVECAWLLSSDEKPTYKKPCPKQQKAQMAVKQMVETAQKTRGETCGKEYPPLLEPDPEDLSPEVAAAMMFSQEQGIKLDSCPDQTVKHLFPSESLYKRPPPSKISIVDPNQKDKEELMEKSASVPSEGVSDSAYTRTMKQKGGDEIPSQKSYDLDFALGQEKREVVLVPQRPKRFNMIQFRGNLMPWFPGYLAAFPDQADSIRIVPSPSKLFLKAWIMTNPENLPASDIIVIE